MEGKGVRRWFLDRRIRERAAFVARKQYATRGDKAVRAQSIRGRMAQERLYVPAGAPWLADFRAELLSFPAGRHDDQVDALGLIGQQLDQMVRPVKVQPKPPTMWDRWDREERDCDGEFDMIERLKVREAQNDKKLEAA